MDSILELEGSKIICGGKPLTGHKIPKVYGSWEPTLVYVPFKHFRAVKKFELLTTELFGPFSIVTEYANKETETVIEYLE